MDAEATRDGVKLSFFNPSTKVWEEVLDRDYRPHFFIPYPVTQKDKEILDGLRAKTRPEQKRNLFTGQLVKVTRVEIDLLSDPKRVSESFEKSWEGDVPLLLGYAYDRNLTFGAQHIVRGRRIETLLEVSEKTKQKFEEEFSVIRDVDPIKYSLLERWFSLCSQPIPEVASERLGIGGRVDSEQYYLAFMLSRVANLPVRMAYSSHQVSTWIRSILHNHLRRSNVLIPASKELRRGETTRSVQGALTFPPETGIHFNTVVVDFHSLYPSLIDVYNLSHETIDCLHEECQSNKVPGLEHYICRRSRGIYSLLVGALRDLRVRWYKPLASDKKVSSDERRLAKATSQLLKLILVSSYGVTVRIHGLARPALAESITAYGRYCLQTSWDIAKEGGLHPIYGDTDSIFLDDPGEEQVQWLIRTVKQRLHLDLAVDERYSVCVLPRAMKAYFGIRKDGTSDVKGVTAIKSNSPTFIQNVFRDCVKQMADVKNQMHYAEAKDRIQRVVKNAIDDLKAGKVTLKDLEYQVEVHEDPVEKKVEKVLHQPYQCAVQLIDLGKPIQKRATVSFVKVKPFQYRGRTFTVKPTEHVKGFHEVNVDDYVRNLRTALNQTFKPMNIRFSEDEKRKVTLADFV
jgi:DNA polymerase elongation subunit (family B)